MSEFIIRGGGTKPQYAAVDDHGRLSVKSSICTNGLRTGS